MQAYAILYKDSALFACLDDKRRIKCGEPGYPVAAAKRGRRVVVSNNESFHVGDHDFCKFSLIPIVSLLIDIPESMEHSWYEGQVYITYKDPVHKPSSPLRHNTELYSILCSKIRLKSVLYVHTDGGPDHRLTYLSVQLSLIALFRNLNLDLLIAGQTALCHSWKNPVERMMSIVNLGLQCVGMIRREGSDNFERRVKHANNLEEVRKATSELKKVKEACCHHCSFSLVDLHSKIDVFFRLRVLTIQTSLTFGRYYCSLTTLCNDLTVLSRFSLADLSSKNSLTIAVSQGTIPFAPRSVEAIPALYVVRCAWMQQHFLL